MSRVTEEQNYWPGYLDALVNVMLNLLLLVAMFAAGLVLLNTHTMFQRGQLTALGGQTRQMIGDLDIDPPAKQALLQKIESLDIRAMLARREQAAALREPAPPPAPPPAARRVQPDPQANLAQAAQAAQAAQLAEAARLAQVERAAEAERQAAAAAEAERAVAVAAEAAKLKTSIEDRRRQLSEAEQRLKDLLNRISQEKSQLALLQARPAPPPYELVLDLRTAVPGQQMVAGGDVRQVLLEQLGMAPYWTGQFAPGEFLWGRSRPLPQELAAADKSGKWRLIAFADADNARIRREVFARMQTLREWLVQQGFRREQLQVEMKSSKGIAGIDEQAFRLVFMLPQP